MFRVIVLVIWLLLSAWLLLWVGLGLFGTDQRSSFLPFLSDDSLTAPIMIGTAWGILLTFGGMMGGVGKRTKIRGESRVGIGRIVEASRTGLTINDVPQYDLFVRVSEQDGTEFIGRVRMLLDPVEQGSVAPGLVLPVRYAPEDHDTVEIADMTDPAVREAILEWRIQRGLIPPHLVRARRSGLQAPASVLAMRPTGVRREEQIELEVRLLITPEGQQGWEADTTVFVYPDALSRVQVGSSVWARYFPGDPHTVAMTIEQEVSA